MSIDHNRPLPVSDERLAAVARMLYPNSVWPQPSITAEVYTIALLGEQIEYLNHATFFLNEAYDIYNARFR